PLPMTSERLATTNALDTVNPELKKASSAGQWTGSPRFMATEARSPRMADVPANQEAAYTQGVMRQAGSGGMFDAAGRAEAKQTGDTLGMLQNANTMSPTEYAL